MTILDYPKRAGLDILNATEGTNECLRQIIKEEKLPSHENISCQWSVGKKETAVPRSLRNDSGDD